MRTSLDLRHSYCVRGLLAAGVLYWVLDLSAANRTWVDYVVIALVVAAIGFNVVQLSRKMRAHGGRRAVWQVQRTTLFWIIGTMNTIWIRPEEVGSWKNYLGYLILVIAIVDTAVLYRRESSIGHRDAGPASAAEAR